MDEKTFKNKYRRAYDRIVPREECVNRILNRNEKKSSGKRIITVVGSGTAAVAAMCLLALVALPSVVKASPSLYIMVAKYAPSLADYCLPAEYDCTRQGITMQVEAINVDGKRAEIVLSFSDAEGGGDLIHGKAEMLGSYGIHGYGFESSISGCSFLGYDETEDKAYFKMDLTGFQQIKKGKIVLTVSDLLTEITEEEQWLSMESMVKDPATKEVRINGRGGGSEACYYFQEKNAFNRLDPNQPPYAPGFSSHVMDIQGLDVGFADDITVVGIGYIDSVLRVQVCRGSFDDADRHAQIYLVDSKGEERIWDMNVGWSEEIGGERLSFDEEWFIIDEDELEEMQMYGIFYRNEGCVHGNWEVTLELE